MKVVQTVLGVALLVSIWGCNPTSSDGRVVKMTRRDVVEEAHPVKATQVAQVQSATQASAIQLSIDPIPLVEMAEVVKVDVAMEFAKALVEVDKEQIPMVYAATLEKVDVTEVPTILSIALASVEGTEQVLAIYAVTLVKVDKSNIPTILGISLANASEVDVPKIVSMTVESMDIASCALVASEVYATFVKMTSKMVSKGELASLRKEWYEKFQATPSSRLWWILNLARERAEQGADVSDLKKLFDETMANWLQEDD